MSTHKLLILLAYSRKGNIYNHEGGLIIEHSLK